MSIGGRIKAIRECLEISLAELAKRAGLAESYLRDIEDERVIADVATLEKIAAALGCVFPGLFYDGEAPELPNLPDRLTGDDIVNGKRRKDRK